MNTIKDEAIILRNRRFSESSLVATLLSRDHGRVDVLAKGCRREKSPMFGHLDLYQKEEVLIFRRQSGGLDLLTEAAFVDEHAGLRFFPPAFAAAGMLADFAAEATLPGEPQPELYRVLAGSLEVLSAFGDVRSRAGLGEASTFNRDEKTFLVGRALKLSLLDMLGWLGFGLELGRCVLCGTPRQDNDAGTAFLSGRHGGLVCGRCRSKAAGGLVTVSGAALQSLRERGKGGERHELRLRSGERRRLLKFLVDYCQIALERPLKGRKVLFQLLD